MKMIDDDRRKKNRETIGNDTWTAEGGRKEEAGKTKIISTTKGTENDNKGTVEFIATYEQDGEGLDHHEVSQFRKSESGEWFFIDGDAHTHREGEDHHHHKPQQVVREAAKIGRNDPCTCGSGRKYKKCCGSLEAE